MSYQTIDVGQTERFFTVVNRLDGLAIESGGINYYLKAKSGENDGKWWRDSDKTWQSFEVANPMTHEADGHWEIDLSESPFVDGVKYLEYVKATSGSHVPNSRHLIARYAIFVDSDGNVVASNISDVDTNAIIATIITALKTVEIRPNITILGPCKKSPIQPMLDSHKRKLIQPVLPKG